METIKFRIYGRDGHRQKLSFEPSRLYDFSSEETGTRIIEFFNSDRTGTNEYVDIAITCDTAEKAFLELEGQLSDGFFENVNWGHVAEINEAGKEINSIYF